MHALVTGMYACILLTNQNFWIQGTLQTLWGQMIFLICTCGSESMYIGNESRANYIVLGCGTKIKFRGQYPWIGWMNEMIWEIIPQRDKNKMMFRLMAVAWLHDVLLIPLWNLAAHSGSMIWETWFVDLWLRRISLHHLFLRTIP